MRKYQKSVIIAFAVDKGGTGKTTTVVNTSAGLAQEGYKVLAVDVDQQANLTNTFLSEPPSRSLYDSIDNESVPLPVVEVSKNLNLVPASEKMYGISAFMIARSLRDEYDYHRVLSRLLDPIRENYDFVLIDCPPSDNIMTFNALFAADTVVIVTKPEEYAMAGCHKMCEIIRSVRKQNHPLGLAGVLFCDVDLYSRGHLNAIKSIREMGPEHVFRALIRHSRYLYNAIQAHKDIFSFAPNTNGEKDYKAFCLELLNKIKRK